VLAVNQKSRGNRQLFHANGLAAWAADDPETRSKYIALFNTGDRGEHGPEAGTTIPVRLSDVGFDGPVVIKDVWSGKRIGVFSGDFAPVIPYHGAGLYRMTAIDARATNNLLFARNV
jgi:alpha-galactosidase